MVPVSTGRFYGKMVFFCLLNPSQPEARILEQHPGGRGIEFPMVADHRPLKMPWITDSRSSSKSNLACCALWNAIQTEKNVDTIICAKVGSENAAYVADTSETAGTLKGAIFIPRAVAAGLHEHANGRKI